MRSSHGAIQPPPDSRKPTRNFGCRSQTPPQITARQASINLHRVGDDVPRAAAFEAVDANLRPAAAGAFVDAVRIHVRHAGMRVETALAAFLVLHRIAGDDALARADPAGAAEPGLGAAEDLLLDDEALLAVLVFDQPRRPVAEAGLHVIVPQIERLEHMPVGIA